MNDEMVAVLAMACELWIVSTHGLPDVPVYPATRAMITSEIVHAVPPTVAKDHATVAPAVSAPVE